MMQDHAKGCEGRNYTCTCGYDTALSKRVAELEAALEFYADELTWADTNPIDDDRITVLVPSPSFAEIDRGKVARAALIQERKDG
jgi:hypothetical protein